MGKTKKYKKASTNLYPRNSTPWTEEDNKLLVDVYSLPANDRPYMSELERIFKRSKSSIYSHVTELRHDGKMPLVKRTGGITVPRGNKSKHMRKKEAERSRHFLHDVKAAHPDKAPTDIDKTFKLPSPQVINISDSECNTPRTTMDRIMSMLIFLFAACALVLLGLILTSELVPHFYAQ